MSKRVCLIVIAPVAAIILLATSADAETSPDFRFVTESAIFSPATQEVLFTVAFNQPPDFLTTDVYGRQKNSFQYFIGVNGWPDFPYPPQFDAVIRGEEIHLTKGEIRIRNPGPSYGEPSPGGWGSIRGVVPYKVNGAILTFSVPLKVITDESVDGSFLYKIDSYQDGATTKLHGQSLR